MYVILSGRTRAGGTHYVRRVSTKRQREAKNLTGADSSGADGSGVDGTDPGSRREIMES